MEETRTRSVQVFLSDLKKTMRWCSAWYHLDK